MLTKTEATVHFEAWTLAWNFPVSESWYQTANNIAKDIADFFGFDHKAVIGAMAVISPKTSWENNIKALVNVCAELANNGDFDRMANRTPGININLRKAWDILLGDFSKIRGQKVNAFYQNILDCSTDDGVTIDIHMIRLAYNDLSISDKDPRAKLSGTQYQTIASALIDVAEHFGISPIALQAGLWEKVREENK